jgi:CBS domain containing-hemolysin-like protein
MAEVSTTTETPSRQRNGLWRKLIRSLTRLDEGDAAAEVAEVLREREAEGDPLQGASKDMLLKAARFDQLSVADVMTPRTDIVAVEAAATISEAMGLFISSQHSRLPIFRETLDDPLGFVHVKDLLALFAPQVEGGAPPRMGDRILPRIKREILFVPPSMRLPSLLLRMRTTRIHLALVVDEYGGTDGLVSIEDLVEQIVGDIDDEHDDEEIEMIQVKAGAVYEVDGRAEVQHLEENVKASLALPDTEDDFDTVAGLAVALVGRVPQRGEVLFHPAGFTFEILEGDARRVKRLRIKANPAGELPPGANGAAASPTP